MIEKSWATEFGLKGRSIGPQLLPAKPRDKQELTNLLETGSCIGVGVLLVSESGGTAKTAFTKALENTGRYEITNIIGSKAGIETIRELTEILQYLPLAEQHLIIVNETSDASHDFLNGLRNLIDDSGDIALFVFTDNYKDKLKTNYSHTFNNSRVMIYDFGEPDKADFKKILEEILVEKNATVKDLDRVVERTYPDLRQAIKVIERTHENG